MTRTEVLNIMRESGTVAAYSAVFGERWGAGLSLIPRYMQEGMVLYVLFGVAPGGFLSSVIANDLMGALSRADDTNRYRLFDYSVFLTNYAPSGCFGSWKLFHQWVAEGGALQEEAE